MVESHNPACDRKGMISVILFATVDTTSRSREGKRTTSVKAINPFQGDYGFEVQVDGRLVENDTIKKAPL